MKFVRIKSQGGPAFWDRCSGGKLVVCMKTKLSSGLWEVLMYTDRVILF